MSELELKPCPFCGGEKYRMIKPDGVWRVLCLTCKTEGRPSVMNIDAKSAWNKRPLETALEAINAELERQNRSLTHLIESMECDANGDEHPNHPRFNCRSCAKHRKKYCANIHARRGGHNRRHKR